MTGVAKAIAIYVDADACPVKAEIYRVAERYAIKVYVVCNVLERKDHWHGLCRIAMRSSLIACKGSYPRSKIEKWQREENRAA